METLLTPAIIFLTACALGFLFFYSYAYTHAKRYPRDVQEYKALANEFEKISERVFQEADQWPIFARPVLFTDYDHDAQIGFAEAYKSLQEGQAFYSREEIPTIKFQTGVNLVQLVDFKSNYNVISQSTFINQKKRGLREKISEISRSLKFVQTEHYKLEQLRKDVRKELADFRQAIDGIDPIVNDIRKWDLNSGDKVLWALKIANDSYSYAVECFKKRTDDEQEYREYAVAKVCVLLGNSSLDYIRIFATQYKIPDRYELDIFNAIFVSLKAHLDTSLEQSLDGWKKLRRTKEYIDEFPGLKDDAEASLSEFKKLRAEFEMLEERVNKVHFKTEIDLAQDVQDKCLRYFYPFQDRDTEWRKCIGSHQLPSKSLSQVEDEKISNIDPMIGSGLIIKQSSLSLIIDRSKRLLSNVSVIKSDIQSLDKEFHRQQKAEKIVGELLDYGGRTFFLIANVEQIIKDSAPDIVEKGNKYIDKFNVYGSKAKQIKGVDFTQLHTDLLNLNSDCESLLGQHETLLKDEETKYSQMKKTLGDTIDEIENIRISTPTFEQQILERLEVFRRDGTNLFQQKIKRNYSALNRLSNEMSVWNENYRFFAGQLTKRKRDFLANAEETYKQVNQARLKLGSIEEFANKKKGWVQSQMLDALRDANHRLGIIEKNWLRYKTENWTGMTYQDAIGECENTKKLLPQIIEDANYALDRIRENERIYDENIKHVLQIAEENKNNISDTDTQTISRLITVAKRAPTRDFAEDALRQANSFATEHISPRMRESANVTINNYTQHVEGGIHVRDNAKFVGQNDYSTNGISAEQLALVLNSIFTQIDKKSNLTVRDKGDLKAEVQEIGQELSKQENADENFILRRMRNIRRMAPDILETILATMANPAAGFGLIAAKIAEKIRQDAMVKN